MGSLGFDCPDIEAACSIYAEVPGMRGVEFDDGRMALALRRQKINLHQFGKEFTPHAECPIPGSADLCFLTDQPMERIVDHIIRNQIKIIEGRVQWIGATGPIYSVNFREPDGNLIEIANQLSTSTPDQNYAA